MELELEGKRVLITGASKGIGLAILKAFTAEGASVIIGRGHRPLLDVPTGAHRALFILADQATSDGPPQEVEIALARTRSSTC